MKIVAIVERTNWSGRYLVEMTDTEIRRLSGLDHNRSIMVGHDLDIGQATDALHRLRSEASQAKRLASTLTALGTMLTQELPQLEAHLSEQSEAAE